MGYFWSKAVNLAGLKSDAHKLDIDKLEKPPSGLNCIKNKVDKLDVDKMVLVPVYSCKVSSAVKNDAAKKTEYDK